MKSAERGHAPGPFGSMIISDPGPGIAAEQIALVFQHVGQAQRQRPGPGAGPLSLRLAHVLEDQGFLLCRYTRNDH